MTYKLFLSKAIIKKYLACPIPDFVIPMNAWRYEFPGGNICEHTYA